jgi:hypothetical protein
MLSLARQVRATSQQANSEFIRRHRLLPSRFRYFMRSSKAKK